MRIPKTIAIGLGLALGWWAAGVVQDSLSAAQDPHADPPSTASVAEGPQETGHGGDAGSPHGPDAPHRDADHGEQDDVAHHDNANVRALAPREDPGFFSAMTTMIIVLFVLAAVVGSAALLMRGPEPPDPADEHHH